MRNTTLFLIVGMLFVTFNIFAQQNVSINETGALPDQSAILDISSSDKGILIPRMTTSQRENIFDPAKGLLVFDLTLNNLWYYNGAEWFPVSQPGSTETIYSLDESYDFGGSGLGRTINADAGAVLIYNTTSTVSDQSAILEISSTDKGLLIPRMTTAQRENISIPAKGLIVFDLTLNNFWFYNGAVWLPVSQSGAGGGTLDEAYDFGGPGLGKTITADSGPVFINNTTGAFSDQSAILDISSVNKGFLTPRMSTAQRESISVPAKGLLVFDITLNNFWFYNGTEWLPVSQSSANGCTLDEAYDFNGPGNGRTISADEGAVIINALNNNGMEITASSSSTIGLKSICSNTGVAVSASSTNPSNTYSTIQATTNSSSNLVSAILGSSSGASYGVSGQIEASATGSAAIYGNNLRTNGGHGVFGFAYNGVVGQTNYADGFGVYGVNTSSTSPASGVYGVGFTGVYGQTELGLGFGILGENLSAGTTDNNVGVGGWGWVGVFGRTSSDGFGVFSYGELGSSGTKSFVIDHPLDPENKMLKHYCAESPEVLNIYRGNILLDVNGEAKVELPDYFKEINTEFSYYLTPIGSPANLYIKQEVVDNYFVIAGGEDGLKVSWILYAKRSDLYTQTYTNSTLVEVEKRISGKYIHPELYGKSETEGMFYFKKIESSLKEELKNSKQSMLNIKE